jgi:GMP synthase-like glutamine amidotransferase
VSERNGRLRVLIIEHERETPGGLIYEWLAEHDAQVEDLHIDVDDRDVDPTDYDLLIPLGSEFAAYDDTVPFIEREKKLLRAAADAEVPVLGICFGGQLLARVLGGESFRAEQSEIGWLPVRSSDPELVPEGPWFQWHFDSFTVPEGATLLAESDAGPQAYVIGRSLGVQFHPEVTPQIMDEWVRVYRHELDDSGVDPDALLAETHRNAATAKATSRKLLDAYLERILKP